MAKKENKKIEKAVETYEVLTGDEEVKRLAEIRLMSELEEQSALASARDKGTREGIEIGHKEGREIGKKEEKIEITKKLLKQNISIGNIVEATGLSKEEIEKIKDNID